MPQVGVSLSSSVGSWSNNPTSYAYQWKRGGVAISGATSATYVPVTADVGQTLSLTVIASNAGGASLPVTSSVTSAVIAAASGTTTTTSLKFGAYNGYAESAADGSAAFVQTEAMISKALDFCLAFGDFNPPSGSWGNGSGATVSGLGTAETSAAYNLSVLKATIGSRKLIWSQPIALGSYSSPTSGAAMSDVLAGTHDASFTYIAQQLVSNGFSNAVVRIGWEMNLNAFPWGVNYSAPLGNTTANYIASFQRVVGLFRAVSSSFKFHWCPNKGQSDQLNQNVTAFYPGDAYVDYVGLDVYDNDTNYSEPQGYTAGSGGDTAQTALQRWQTSCLGGLSDYRLAWLASYSTTPSLRGTGASGTKPIIIGEWAAGGPTSIQNGSGDSYALRLARAGGDDGTFSAQMMAWLQANAYGAVFYDIFDTSISYTGAASWDPHQTGMLTAGYKSSTANAIGTGTLTYTVGKNLPFAVDMPVLITDDANASYPTAGGANTGLRFIEAQVSSYVASTGALVVYGFASQGSGTPASIHIATHPAAIAPNTWAAIRSALSLSTTGATAVADSYTVAPLTISGTPAAGNVGTAYSFVPSVSNGSGSRSFTLTGTLPGGLVFSTTTGAITGTPTTAATTSGLNISVNDSTGTVSLGTFSLIIGAALTNLIPSAAQNDLTNAAWSWNASGGTNDTVAAGSIKTTVAQSVHSDNRQFALTFTPNKVYKLSVIASNGTPNGNYVDMTAYDGNKTFDIYVNVANGTYGTNADGGLGASASVTAGPNAGEYTVSVSFTTTSTAGAGNVSLGVGTGNVGQINFRSMALLTAPVVLTNLVSPTAAQNDLTNSAWSWNTQGSSTGSVTAGEVTSTTVQYSASVERQILVPMASGKTYDWSTVVQNDGGNYAIFAGSDGAQAFEAYLDLTATPPSGGFNVSGLSATFKSITAGPGTGQYTIVMEFTATTSANSSTSKVAFGVGSGSSGGIKASAFSVVQTN